MSARQQNVTPRGRRTTKKQAPAGPKRRKRVAVRWLRWTALATAVCAVVMVYLAVANSSVFAVNRVEVEGAKRMAEERVRAIVQRVAGPQMFHVDLDAVREALEAESYVKTASVVRVLPDTLRVRIEEREPEVVARLRGGGFGWVDAEGRLLEGYVAPGGSALPPPLLGYEDEDKSDRAAADNRARVGRYAEIRTALADGKLWDRVDEVDLRYVNDARLQLTESAIVVRVGDKDYRARLQAALELLEAVRRGDAATLARYHVTDVSRLLASADSINSIDMARSSGVSILFDPPRAPRPAAGQQASGGEPTQVAAGENGKKPEPERAAVDTSAAAAKTGVRPPAEGGTPKQNDGRARKAGGETGPRATERGQAERNHAGPRTAERGKN
jgi:cell division septal protein FtsQ